MCTGVRLIAQNNSVTYGRTLEFAELIDSQLLMLPRNYHYQSKSSSDQKISLSWKTKYAVVGANVANLIDFVDGVNEKGLAGGLFYFSEYA